ncbi:MAG TPA: DUF4912 domain-containing protein [Leptospiraceae bacterium]|nr:DUF4912 domain-containing protein [Leptospiraceae bacterium]HMW05221.1 DUF4912 domain-containing protein [Leptospiraceae bacterium]HMX31314.1 DUF4912 domain-containing protein [Leptospiraceae bacterium]HMY32120.1 DUF4912 domain-containing protein [Leptospiraceae bacterium]HMZ67384.1 DUF4912 domain-containing protein [Leptospiraceae bacterium]
MTEEKKSRIYLDPKFDRLPDYYNRDIVKILTKNLKEAYVFWGISTESFKKILDTFNCSKNEVYFKLIVRYAQEDKIHRHKEIFLPPFTNNWFLEFDQRIKNLKVEVIAFSQAGHSYSLLHSAEISIPSHKPSKVLHRDWLKASWIKEFNLVDVNGEIHIQDGPKQEPNSNTITINQSLSEELEWQEGFFTWPDGSSGFMGSSGIFASSSNHMRKKNEQ